MNSPKKAPKKEKVYKTGKHVIRSGSCKALGDSQIQAFGDSSVEARENSRVEAWGNSRVEAWGNSRVEARDNSNIISFEEFQDRSQGKLGHDRSPSSK